MLGPTLLVIGASHPGRAQRAVPQTPGGVRPTGRCGVQIVDLSQRATSRPRCSRAKLIFQTKPGSYNTESLIAYLAQLRRHLPGKPVILMWDGLSAHRCKAMKARLNTQRHWLRVEGLPGYAHDLNPMELGWGNLKATELANLCPDTLDEADTAANTGLDRIGSSYQLCFNFLAHTGLRV